MIILDDDDDIFCQSKGSLVIITIYGDRLTCYSRGDHRCSFFFIILIKKYKI